MSRRVTRRVLRGALLQYAAVTALILVVLSVAAVAGAGHLARRDAERTAARVSETLAAAVISQLESYDFGATAGVAREALLAEVTPFIESGAIYRVKLWLVTGERASIVFSDESAVEGVTRDTDPDFQRRLDAGDVVAHEVPNDHEHRFEFDRSADLVEVFLGFDDAAGNAMSLEAYVPVDVSGSTRYSISVLLPLVGGALLVLAVGLVPLTFALARRMQRASDERARFASLALTASDRERRELAQRLHDGPIQDLAAAGVMLASNRAQAEPAGATRADAQLLLRGSIRQLRSLAEDLAGNATRSADARAAIAEVARQIVPTAIATVLVVQSDLLLEEPTMTLVVRAARELLRNAVGHGRPDAIRVDLARLPDGALVLTVIDDGAGFDPDAAPDAGHLGLALLTQSVEGAGGRIAIESVPGRGTRATIALS